MIDWILIVLCIIIYIVVVIYSIQCMIMAGFWKWTRWAVVYGSPQEGTSTYLRKNITIIAVVLNVFKLSKNAMLNIHLFNLKT